MTVGTEHASMVPVVLITIREVRVVQAFFTWGVLCTVENKCTYCALLISAVPNHFSSPGTTSPPSPWDHCPLHRPRSEVLDRCGPAPPLVHAHPLTHVEATNARPLNCIFDIPLCVRPHSTSRPMEDGRSSWNFFPSLSFSLHSLRFFLPTVYIYLMCYQGAEG